MSTALLADDEPHLLAHLAQRLARLWPELDLAGVILNRLGGVGHFQLQKAAIEALKQREEDVPQMRDEYDQRRRVIVKRLRAMGLSCFEPEGAFYAFPSIAHTGLSSFEFAERLLMEQRVAVVPGRGFGECGEGFIRCCYATSLPEIEEAMTRMARFLDSL